MRHTVERLDNAAAPIAPIAPAAPAPVQDSGELDRLRATCDAQKATIADLTTKLADATSTAVLDSRVAVRVALVTRAAGVLGADFKADGKTDREIKIACVQKIAPTFKADGKSDDYVAAYFDSVTEQAQVATNALAKLNVNTAGERTDAAAEGDPVAKAEAANRARSANAWKTTGSK